jgi:excisionase family DNA binding protein
MKPLPMLLTVDEAAELLRTSRRAIYAMVERGQLPGVVRIRRRVLVRADDLLHWLDQKRVIAEGVMARAEQRTGRVEIGGPTMGRGPPGTACAATQSAESREGGADTRSVRAGVLDGHARANRHKPSGIMRKESVLNKHLIPVLGSKKLDAITTEHVQDMKRRLLKKAVERDVTIDRMPCTVRLLPIAKPSARFYDFDDFDRLVAAAKVSDPNAYLILLLGGEAGLRLGEIIALEWSDIDLGKRQVCVQRSEWRGHVTVPKGWRLRYVPLTARLAGALREHRHLRSARVVCQRDGLPLSQWMVRDHVPSSGRCDARSCSRVVRPQAATPSVGTWRCVERQSRRDRRRDSTPRSFDKRPSTWRHSGDGRGSRRLGRCRGEKVGGLPTGACAQSRRRMVDQIFPRWNPLTSWMRQIEDFQRAA